uniref:Uncharacterized protein n=1 Tax=Cacopsylla melanoneura TaxID=428564 RepID=A0A8D9B9K6_9HEMI
MVNLELFRLLFFENSFTTSHTTLLFLFLGALLILSVVYFFLASRTTLKRTLLYFLYCSWMKGSDVYLHILNSVLFFALDIIMPLVIHGFRFCVPRLTIL